MTVTRDLLPTRRTAETFTLTLDALRQFQVTVGYYKNGQLGEVFISGAKSGTEVEAVARDGAVLLSLALQYGIPLEVIRGAITREPNGRAMTVVGAVVDKMVAMAKEQQITG